MAYAAELAALTEGLIEAITGFSARTQPRIFNSLRDATAHKLQHHPYLRINQFDITSQLEGLEERFRVHCRDGLADALNRAREDLDELTHLPSGGFHPDILYLLLELADHPVTKSDLAEVRTFKYDAFEEAPKPLRWEDIAVEDGWDQDEPEMWAEPDYSDISDEEIIIRDDSKDVSMTEMSADLDVDEAGLDKYRSGFLVEIMDEGQRDRIEKAQKWRWKKPAPDAQGRIRKIPVSEFAMVREVLFMLQGLPTTLFKEDYSPDPAFQLGNIAWETYKNIAHIFSESGSKLAVLRGFINTVHKAHHLQVFSDAVAKRLQSFDTKVVQIEQRILAPKEDVTISLFAIQAKLAPALEPLEILGTIVKEVRDIPNMGAFQYIELLFNEINIAQTIGRTEVAEFLVAVFLECFQLYLKLIRMWMEEGKLLPGDQLFFISESSVQMPLNHLWKEQFKLRQSRDGKLYAPSFVNAPAKQIFTAGKSIVILKNLGQYQSFKADASSEPPLVFAEIAPNGLGLALFADLFMHWFDRWISSKLGQTSNTLKTVLLENCGLRHALKAMEVLYLMADSTVSDAFCLTVFNRINSLSPTWNDHYALTSTAQEAYAATTLTTMHSNRIKVIVKGRGNLLSVREVRDNLSRGSGLDYLHLTYRLTWPIQLVISEQNIGGYQAIFTFLLQIRRAAHMLADPRLLPLQATDHLWSAWPEYASYYGLRNRLLWFCNTLRAYLTGIVLAPACETMHREMESSNDVDEMLQVQFRFMKRVLNECCLSPKLGPLHEAMIDILQLSINLETARRWWIAREDREYAEIEHFNMTTTPHKRRFRASLRPGGSLGASMRRTPVAKKIRHPDSSDEEDGTGLDEAKDMGEEEGFVETLKELTVKYEGSVRFIADGLRAVARATGDSSSGKWDLLAEMLDGNTAGERSLI